MREVSYVLRFERTATGEPTVARGLVTVTSLGVDGPPVETARFGTPGSASYESEYELDPDGIQFKEAGTVTFGTTPEHTLSFDSIGSGYLLPPPDPETNLTPGIVMWRVLSGTGFFEGATGSIASSFRVDLPTGRLVDDHLGTIRLPDLPAS